MGDVLANIVKGRFARYADLPEANDAMILVLLLTAGLESDATLIDYDTLSAVLAAANDEATFTGYTRRTLASVVVTVDDTNNRVDVDAADPSTYTNTAGSGAVSKAVVCYDSDTTGGTDANIVPVAFLDCIVTFDVNAVVTLQFGTSGFARAS